MVRMKYWSSQCINHCVTSQHVFQILKQAWNYTMMFVHVGPSGFVGLYSVQLLLPCALKILFLCFPERTPGVSVRAWDLPSCWFVSLQTIQSDPPLISSKQDGEAQPNPHNELWQAFALSSFPLSPFFISITGECSDPLLFPGNYAKLLSLPVSHWTGQVGDALEHNVSPNKQKCLFDKEILP